MPVPAPALESQTPPTADHNGADTGTDHGSDAPAGNAWDSARQSIGELLEEAVIPKDPDEKPSKGKEPAGSSTPAKDDDKKPENAKTAGERSAPPPYKVLDADGEEAEVDWPEGHTVQFRAGKRTVEVKSWEDAVDLMQKGADYARQGSQLGQRAAEAERQLRELQESSVPASELERLENLLLLAVFDDEQRAKLAPSLEKYLDPEVRATMRKADRDEASGKIAQERAAASLKTLATSSWDQVREGFDVVVEEHPVLTDEDYPAVQSELYGGYLALREHLLTEYKGAAKAAGVTEADAIAQAEKDAIDFLTSDAALDAAMGEVAAKVTKRLEKLGVTVPTTKGGKKEEEDDEEELDDAAEGHNARTRARLAQRRRNRTARGSGGAPAGGGRSVGEIKPGATFDERMAAIRETLEAAKS